jgi:membrane protease YdiL (CAAX protease family)
MVARVSLDDPRQAICPHLIAARNPKGNPPGEEVTRSRISLEMWKQLGLAALLSLVVAGVGSVIWSALLIANARTSPAVPWSVAVMAVVLAAYWWYWSGHGAPKSTATARAKLMRAHLVPLRIFAWSWIAGVLALVALAALWIVSVEVTGNGGNPTESQLNGYPTLFVVLGIAMGSLVSPITEETAFRGYAQVILERRFPAVAAVAISSAFFAAWHGPTQGFFWSKLLFFFFVGVVFGTIAYHTKSILPALPVHIAGDVLFFVVIWPQDAGRPVVWREGITGGFWLEVLQLIVFGAAAVLAFRQLRAITRSQLPLAHSMPAAP